MGVVANISCLLSVLVQPYMPEVSKTIQVQLNAPQRCNVVTEHFVSFLPTGHKIGQVRAPYCFLPFNRSTYLFQSFIVTTCCLLSFQPKPLFNKIEASLIAELKKKFAGKEQFKEEAKPGGRS